MDKLMELVDKHFIKLVIISAAATAIFWAGVIYVAFHFIAKFW